jgi:hypothetical protein
VFYLRTMLNRIQPYQPQPLPLVGGLGGAELVREAATLVMLLIVGMLAGRTWQRRLGYSAIAFGLWDIFYYVFLKVLCGWPHSLFDWDILFLLPLPWWGPVAAPASIALLMILWGTLVTTWNIQGRGSRSDWKIWMASAAGMGLALYVFMADNLRVARQGPDAWRNVLPTPFRWTLFCVAFVLMAAPVLDAIWRLWGRRFNDDAESKKENEPSPRMTWQAPALSPSKGERDSETVRPSTRPALDYDRWLVHFARNREHRPEPDWTAPITLPTEVHAPLLRSIEQFQLGDGGGPASLIARDADRFRNSTRQMPALVDLWFAEEQEHSRLLGCAVDALGGTRIESHWSFTAFCQSRRVFGVGFELKVLLLTEISSTAYYRLLERHSPIPALAAMCGLILRDEAGHIAFHCDRLAADGKTPNGFAGRLWAAQFCCFGYAAATMLWVNHGKCLKALGATRKEFYGELRIELRRFLKSLARRRQGSEANCEGSRPAFAVAVDGGK